MTSAPGFRPDLYRGTAPYYDRYRPPYPDALLDDLRARLPLRPDATVLDLACGTGQLACPLARHSAQVVAVDQEPESVAFGRDRAAARGVANIAWLAGSAETVVLRAAFDLVTIGNAFHRVDRAAVAPRLRSWLAPGGGVALVWAETPNQGDQPWQMAMEELFVEWMAKAGTADRVPAGWHAAMEHEPHEQILRRAGFHYVGKFELTVDHTWTIETLIGFAYSTSLLNPRALGDLAPEFERSLDKRLRAFTSDGTFHQSLSYAYELARRDPGCVPFRAARAGAGPATRPPALGLPHR